MRKAFFLTLISILFEKVLFAQCLTDYEKLSPASSLEEYQLFGYDIAVQGNTAIVGAPSSDSLAYDGGMAFIYERNDASGEWVETGYLYASDVQESSRFGHSVDFLGDVIVVGAPGLHYGSDPKPSKIYFFERPASGWETSSETAQISFAGTAAFGTEVKFRESSDLVFVGDPFYNEGAVFIIENEGVSWSEGNFNHQIIEPEPFYTGVDRSQWFGSGIEFSGSNVSIAAPDYNFGRGAYYLYEQINPSVFSWQESGRLEISDFNVNMRFQDNFEFLEDTLITLVQEHDVPERNQIAFFTTSDNWVSYELTLTPLETTGNFADSEPALESLGPYTYIAFKMRDQASSLYRIDRKRIAESNYYPEGVYLSDSTSNSFPRMSMAGDNGNLLLGMSNDPETNAFFGSVYSIQLSDNLSEIQLSKHGRSFTGFTDKYFGETLHITHDGFLLIGSPTERLSIDQAGGAVYIYENKMDEWKLINRVDSKSENRFDDLFGRALASTSEIIVVGSPGFDNGGMISIYDRSGGIGNLNLIQSIEAPEDISGIRSFGGSVAVSDSTLAVSCRFNGPSGVRYGLVIYRLQSGSSWIREDFIEDFSNVSVFNKNGVLSIDINSDILIASNRTFAGACDLFKRNTDGTWENILRLTDFTMGSFSGFGAEIELTENHIFIGAPFYDVDGHRDVGAIFVFTKTGSEWDENINRSIILPFDEVTNGLFGYSIRSVGNIIFSGAPFNDFIISGSNVIESNDPGSLYVIQGLDYFYEKTLNLFKFQGDQLNENDQFGFSVASSLDNFIVSATTESFINYRNTGSAYVIDNPPLVKTIPPICKENGVVNLFEYPYGGEWSGDGIVDSSEGIFDPSGLASGTYSITYVTDNCAYEGRLEIEVTDGPAIINQSPERNLRCPGEGVELTVEVSQADTDFQWYQKPNGMSTFIPIEGATTKTYYAMTDGVFYCELTRICTVNSQAMNVQTEYLGVENLHQTFVTVCEGETRELSVKTQNGVSFEWYYSSSTSGTFDIIQSSNSPILNATNPGFYYTRVIGEKCDTITEISELGLKEIEITLNSVQDICEDEMVSFSASPSGGVWSGAGISSEGLFDPAGLKDSVYYMKYDVISDDCRFSELFSINLDRLDEVEISSESDVICGGEGTLIRVNAQVSDFDALQWFYKPDASSASESLSRFDQTLEINATQSGIYWVEAGKYNCSIQSNEYKINISQDSVFVPNVFTPNGDGKNDEFLVVTNDSQPYEIVIMNRYGKSIYHGSNESPPWYGTGTSSGIYFWNLTYLSCNNSSRKSTNGMVQLIR